VIRIGVRWDRRSVRTVHLARSVGFTVVSFAIAFLAARTSAPAGPSCTEICATLASNGGVVCFGRGPDVSPR
jgi:hypothetical protein